ncbi:MAG: lipoyl(octanoyl) transferase LipB [Thermoplasmata archaeon]|nr:lipoyl(octanoyl) transferase LipB [Thermoplasmata archaeon]
MLEIRDWGTRSYPDALAEMRALRAARRRGEIPDTLLLVEHPAVITVGVQGAELSELPPGIPVVHVERGGHSTYHGPGQLVGYPIVDLDARGRNVRGFVGALESLLVEALAELGLRAGAVAGQRGVWVEGERKIASIGVAVEEWVSFHGFALNVDPDLSVFAAFQPCGLDGRRMTSVARELGRPVGVEELRLPVRRAFLRQFDAPVVPLAPPRPTPSALA